jgi:calcineurin-like phosphoesterase family protein
MNESLVENWNDVVDESDVVYHLGDVTHAAGHGSGEDVRGFNHWMSVLNGQIVLLRGNHDHPEETKGLPTFETATLSDGRNGHIYYLQHEPTGFDGWQIHGHVHNSDTDMYPFFSPERKTINVSVEVTGYEPVPLDEISDLVERQYEPVPTR